MVKLMSIVLKRLIYLLTNLILGVKRIKRNKKKEKLNLNRSNIESVLFKSTDSNFNLNIKD